MPADTVARVRVSGQQDSRLGGRAGSCIHGPLGPEVWVAEAVTVLGYEDKRTWGLPGGPLAKSLHPNSGAQVPSLVRELDPARHTEDLVQTNGK